MFKPLCIFLFIYLPYVAYCQDLSKITEEKFAEGITIDLREPLYEEGVLTTEKGGVISGPNIRIQARKMCYTRKLQSGTACMTIEAEGDLILEFGEYTFVGESLYYDFQKKEGVLSKGRTSSDAWFFGGEKIELRSDQSYVIYDGYVTTSENLHPDWGIFSKEVHVVDNRYLNAKNIQVRLFQYTILWIPSLKLNLDAIFDSPIRYRFKWGGRQGPRAGLTYEIFSFNNWKTFVRLDYRLTRGPGAGLETYYFSPDGKTEFQSINYVAKDSALFDRHARARFRFEGAFQKLMNEDKTFILLTYDKVSDIEMPSSYYDKDFDIETSGRTQLLIRRQEDNWIANFYSRARINFFQTVKQELPSFGLNYRPFLLGNTGIIFENWAKASYLDFKYANYLQERGYSSTRFEYRPTLYRTFDLSYFTLTPEIGAIALLYGNSPQKEAKWVCAGFAGGEIHTQLYRQWAHRKHVIEPYVCYRFYSYPTVPPNKHYIFDIDDGIYHLNKFTWGVRNSLYSKNQSDSITRPIFADVYAHAFFNTPHIKPLIPKAYARLTFFTLPTLRHTVETAWDFRHHEIARFNFRVEWTYNADLAIAAEYRHRNAYDWRKADPENFFLDAFRPEWELKHSPLSDRRDTLLLHTFYRFHPNWAAEIALRHGWNRKAEPYYTEYKIDLLTTFQTAWHLRFSFQHLENDNRFVVYVNVGLTKPKAKDCDPLSYFE